MGKNYDPKASEPKWQAFWQENEIYRFDPASSKPIYSIDTPPPTVSGKIHIGHIFSYTQAEVIARYKRMKGFNVFYPFGFDDNGLPTERLVEKEIGKKGSDMDRAEFTKICLETTAKYRTIFEKLWTSIGISADWNLAYSTISPLAQRVSQRSFLELLQKGKIRRENTPALWCTECQTGIAQAELDDKEMESVFYNIAFVGDDGKELVIATTRPELLPACVAVFVHPDDERYETFRGKSVTTPLGEKVPVITDEMVAKEKGTGAVMCCTYGDETDLMWKKKYDLPERIILSKTGHLEGTDIPGLDGLYLKKARNAVIEILREKGVIRGEKSITHVVKTHERCGTPIEILPTSQWFVDILSIKQELIEAGEEIVWYPDYMKKRYLEWVENLKWNWCISRQRFFGIPTPVWYSKKTGEMILPELDELPVDPFQSFPRNLPAGHTTDDIEPDVNIFDTWATSALTPEINAHWGEPDSIESELLPMSFRPQAHDIIRTWTFYTIVKSLLHHGRIPFRSVMISGHVLAKKGEKISKSKGNAGKTPEELIEVYSADAVRLWACGASLGKNTILDEQEIVNGKKLITKLWNVGAFAGLMLEDFQGEKDAPEHLEFVDEYILSRASRVAEEMQKYLDTFEFGLALGVFERFFWHDLCDNYLEIIKDRLYNPEKYPNGENARKSGQYALYHTVLSALKLVAPFIPHITEELYTEYFRETEGEKSIHLLTYEATGEEKITHSEEELDATMEIFFDIIERVRKYKTEKSLKLSTELRTVKITHSEEMIKKLRNIEHDIRGVSRTDQVILETGENFSITIEEK